MFSKTGYRKNSKDKNKPFNIIPSNRISMSQVDVPLFAIDNLGNSKIMYPEEEHLFQGNKVLEIPLFKAQMGALVNDSRNQQIKKFNFSDQFNRQLQGMSQLPIFQSSLNIPQATNNYINDNTQRTDVPYLNQTPKNNFTEQKDNSWLKQIPLFATGALNALSVRHNNNMQDKYRNEAISNPLYNLPYNNNLNEYSLRGMPIAQQGGQIDDEENDDILNPNSFLNQQDENTTIDNENEESINVPEQQEDEDFDQQALIDQILGPDDEVETYNPELINTQLEVQVNKPSNKKADDNDNESIAYNFLLEKGLTAHAASGIVGNLVQESGLNPEAVGDNGTSYGIAQWHNGRKTNVINKSFNEQLEFLFEEAQKRGDISRINNSKTPEEAAYLFAKHFERPKVIDNKRLTNAKRIYNKFNK